VPDDDRTTLTNVERALVKRIADRDGVTEDEAASRLVKEAIARRVKKRSGKPQAKVYDMRHK
jgi:hypothetical protein